MPSNLTRGGGIIRYISVFSGIEAASVAWGPLGWEPVAFSEIDEFPSAVLAHRFPGVPNLGDITKVDWKGVVAEHGPVDVVVGGSPCQSFSIAGGREGLDGESRLMYEYIRCVREVRPRWFLWENVPGVFSTDAGRAFGILLHEMDELGYGLAWRVLDAQFFGVAQRRRRVFLVGCLGEGGASAAVLFESESVSGNTQSSREKRQELARAVEERARSGGFKYHQGADAGGVGYEAEQSPTLTADYHNPAVCEAYSLNREIIPENRTAQGPVEQHEVCPTLDTGSQPHGVAIVGECLTPWDVQSMRIFAPTLAPTLSSGVNQGANIQPTVLCLQTDHLSQNGTNVSDNICKTLDIASQTPVVCIGDDNSNASMDIDLCGTLHVGGGYSMADPAQCVNSTDNGLVNALCAADAKGVGNQYVSDGKLICQKTTC